MKKSITYIAIIFSVMLCLAACRKNRLPDLNDSYSYRDKNPFGAKVAFDMLQNAYPGRLVEFVKKDFSDNFEWYYDTSSLYMNISSRFYMSDRDAESMLDFVYKGNTAFISAERIDTTLLEKLHAGKQTGIGVLLYGNRLRNTSTGYTKEMARDKTAFSYYYYPFNNFFSKLTGMHAHTIGMNESGEPNLCAFFWGKGRIFLQCEPRALSNYFLLTDNNYRYMQEILQLLPAKPENIYWDDQHNAENYSSGSYNGNDAEKSFSTLDTLMKYPALSHAFFIAMFLLIVYIFFNSKRRQRIIPVIRPAENTSIAFTEAIAGLYLGKKDNKLISEKMITYFNEHTRSRYFMNMNINDEGYADMLSRKSGVDADTTERLLRSMRNTAAATSVSDQQLILLNSLIEKFFKNKT